MSNKNFIKTLLDFSYISISKVEQNFSLINSTKNESKIMIIDRFSYKNIQYFILCIDKILCFIQINDLQIIKDFFINNSESTIFLLSLETKKLFINCLNQTEHKIKFVNLYEDSLFMQDIKDFTTQFHVINKDVSIFWENIKNCFSSYLLQKSYYNSRFDRIKNCQEIIDSKFKDIEINEDEYIKLHHLGTGSTSNAHMIYSINDQKVYVLKSPLDETKQEKDLYQREYENYQQIHHPLICQFHGTTNLTKFKYLIIEYIDGILLQDIYIKKLTLKEKMKIIFEIMIIIEYLHLNHFIYRDLKPNNFILNQDNDVILIDLDRMRKEQDDYNFEDATGDFGHQYIAPEIIETRNFSYESDIYSLGKIIYFIIFENENICYENKFKQFPPELLNFQEMCQKSIQKDPKKRPKITELINSFYVHYQNMNINLKELKTIQSNKNIHTKEFFSYWIYVVANTNQYALNKLGKMYLNGKIIDKDIDQAIHYLLLSAEQNNSESLQILGAIYIKDEYGKKDVSKAIHYYTLASNLNNIKACYSLGIIYSLEEYHTFDLNNAIHYYKIAADQGDSDSQNNLAQIFFNYLSTPNDINKAIKYLTLAAQNKNANAQNNLGIIYFFGQKVPKNIKKGLYYLNMAADQNYINSLGILGTIYSNNEYGLKDMNKAIHYFELASKLNSSIAQNELANIYFNNNDIKKAIYYYTLAANQNNVNSQMELGIIYNEGKYTQRNVDLAIHYFTFAAKQNILKAQLDLGFIYLEDKYFNIDKSFYYFQLAAEQNNSEAQNMLAKHYMNKNDIQKAIYYFELAALQNNVEAQFNLGLIYEQSNYVRHDFNKAIYYYTLAAKNNHPIAQYILGLIYCEYNYVPKDYNKGIYYFTLAANQNHADSEIYLGCLYFEGEKINRDINKALKYFNKALQLDHPLGYFNIGVIYFNKKITKQNIQKAIYYFECAANKRYSEAQYILGYIYSEEKYGFKNINKAIYYYTLASNQDHKIAQCNLSFIYFEKGDYNKFFNYLSLSANKFIEAKFILGFIYFDGYYVKKDLNKAISLFKEASSFNHQYAKNNLAFIYKHGYGIQKNISNAIIYYKEAIKKDDEVSMFNLAHIYFYGEKNETNIDEAIKLLIKSSIKNFYYSKILLALVLIQKLQPISFEKVQIELKNKELSHEIYYYIININLSNYLIYKQYYNLYQKYDFVYDMYKTPIDKNQLNLFSEQKSSQNKKSLTKDFYEGFNIAVKQQFINK